MTYRVPSSPQYAVTYELYEHITVECSVITMFIFVFLSQRTSANIKQFDK